MSLSTFLLNTKVFIYLSSGRDLQHPHSGKDSTRALGSINAKSLEEKSISKERISIAFLRKCRQYKGKMSEFFPVAFQWPIIEWLEYRKFSVFVE